MAGSTICRVLLAAVVGASLMSQVVSQEPPVPVDGGWSDWADWSSCSVYCGYGMMYRERVCADPSPMNGGQACDGDNSETMSCGSSCIEEGNWSPWRDWQACSVSCGEGMKNRTRTCNNPAPAYGARPCEGPSYQSASCYLVTCPELGTWGPWTDWQVCPVTCGEGIQTRTRICNDPPSSFGAPGCEGQSSQSSICNKVVLCKVEGIWTTWESWQTCPVTCGAGQTSRTRECNLPTAGNHSNAIRLFCSGDGTEITSCESTTACPVSSSGSKITNVWAMVHALDTSLAVISMALTLCLVHKLSVQ